MYKTADIFTNNQAALKTMDSNEFISSWSDIVSELHHRGNFSTMQCFTRFQNILWLGQMGWLIECQTVNFIETELVVAYTRNLHFHLGLERTWNGMENYIRSNLASSNQTIFYFLSLGRNNITMVIIGDHAI